VLVDLASHLADSLRAEDELARFGGEEFLLVLTGAGAMAAQVVARISKEWTMVTSRPTFSAGVAVHREGDVPEQTVARADMSLYRAKEAGRDCVVVADDPVALPSAS
jgi:diguanylate cyclase